MHTIWAASAALCAAAIAAPALAGIATAEVTGGMVAGTTADGLSEFKGIPYAARPPGPTAGARRSRWSPGAVPARPARSAPPACRRKACSGRWARPAR